MMERVALSAGRCGSECVEYSVRELEVYMSQNIKIKGKNPYDVLALTLTQKCSAQCEKQVSLFTGGTCFACFNIEGI